MKNLKKQLTIAMSLVIFFAFGAKAQSKGDKCVQQGKFVIDAFYGYPFVIGKILKDNSESQRIRNLNHIGGKFEIMLSDVIGLGAEYTFAKVSGYTNKIEYENIDGQYKVITSNFKESITKHRVLVRMNVHFATSDKVDGYFGFGTGFKQVMYKNNFPSDYPVNDLEISGIPLAFRAGIGVRYFFTENIGLNIETGLGGPAIQGGLSVKF